MSRLRWFAVAAALLGGAPSAVFAADPGALRQQLELATEDDDLLARIEILRRIVDAAPADPASRRQLVELWLQAQDYDLAEATVKEWPAAPADLVALTRAAAQRFRDNDVAAAIATLRAHLATAPRDLPAHRALVDALLATPDTAAQITALDELIALEPSAANLLRRANAKFRAGDYPGALADARAAQALAPEDEAVKSALPPFERLAEALAALPPLDAALRKDPRDVPARLARAWWRRYGGMNRPSLEDSAAALEVAPDSLAAKILHVRTRFLLGDITFENARDREFVEVNAPISLESVNEIFAADASVANQPKNPAFRRDRAQALNNAAQYPLAQREAEAALTGAPRDADAALELLFATVQRGEDAAPTLRRIEEMKAPPRILALAYGHLANSALLRSQNALALDFADRSLAQKEIAWVLKVKATALSRLGRTEESQAALTRANSLPQ